MMDFIQSSACSSNGNNFTLIDFFKCVHDEMLPEIFIPNIINQFFK